MSSSTTTPPSIRISEHQRYQSPSGYSSRPASPMAAPRVQDAHQLPLPPPSQPNVSHGHDPGWKWGNDPNSSDFGRVASVKLEPGLLASATKRQRQEKEQESPRRDADRRGSSRSTLTVTTDNEMSDDRLVHSEPDLMSLPSSYGYVFVASLFRLFDCMRLRCLLGSMHLWAHDKKRCDEDPLFE